MFFVFSNDYGFNQGSKPNSLYNVQQSLPD